MYDPNDKKREPDEFALDEEPPDTQPAPFEEGSVIVLDDDGEPD
jgi:hypothetical protein